MIQRKTISRVSRRGSVVALSPAFLTMLAVMAAFMIDYGYLTAAKSRMQSAADSAVLAAAMRIGNDNTAETREDAKLWARNFSYLNLPEKGDVLSLEEVEFGTWDPNSEIFTPSNIDAPNAVRATVRRDGDNARSVSTFFMSIFGQEEVGINATAIAILSSASAFEEAMPLALRAPGFGSVDDDVAEKNPGKEGPSSPADGEAFQVGEQVIVAAYGTSSGPPVHLALDLSTPGDGSNNADVNDVLKGREPGVKMQVGYEYEVFNQGTGNNSFVGALEDRIDTPYTDELRDVVLPIVETTDGSRNGDGELTGTVRISDFVAVHLDETLEIEVEDPNRPGKTITNYYIVGTVTSKRAVGGSGGETPGGAGGGSVVATGIVN